MKFIILSVLVILVGCDTPTRSRFPTASSIGNPVVSPTAGNFTGGATTGGSTTGTTTGGATTSPGFENCNLTKSNSTADLGSLGICKSTLDETVLRFVTSQSDSTSRTCFIPTYKDSTGSSTYLGDPQCTYTEAEKIYTGRFVKNRSGFSQYPINGVMIMKENLLVEYFACMDSYTKYISYYCPANPNYAPCLQGAANYRYQVCTQFKTKYPNNYLDLYFR
jgi:hypothetical protein